MKKGFTLVELAVVLVIVGIIIGMVVKGRSVIKIVKISKEISTVQKIATGVATAVSINNGDFSILQGDNGSGTYNGTYLTNQGLVTVDDMKGVTTSTSTWEILNCTRGAVGNDNHTLTNSFNGVNVCIRHEKLTAQFTCFMEVKMDDRNLTNGKARSKNLASNINMNDCELSSNTENRTDYLVL